MPQPNPVAVRFPDSEREYFRESLKAIAAERNESMNGFIVGVLRDAIAQHEEQKARQASNVKRNSQST